MRSSVLKFPLWGTYSHADGVFLAKLSLSGPFHIIPEYLFFNRVHAQQSMRKYLRKDGQQDFSQYAAWWDPNNQGRIMLPRWKIFREYCKAVNESSIGLYDRLWCYFDILRWARGSWLVMLEELIVATRQIILSSFKTSSREVSADDSV